MISKRAWSAIVCAAAFTWPIVVAQSLSNALVSLVEADLAQRANQSWELGTRSQALLELNANVYSVLSDYLLPPPSTIPENLNDAMTTVLGIAKSVVANRNISNGGRVGPQPLINDSAAGDPASIGMAVLLANWTGQGRSDGYNYSGAAQDQLDFLFQDVPKTSDGAISQRTEQLQLWSDFVYMVPPFLAYYGMISNNQTLLSEAYNQILLYRNYLRDPNANNLWHHILLGSGTDEGHWATGNGWAAAGMLRVLGTIQNSQYANSMKSEQNDLAKWVTEIQDGMYGGLDANWLFRNYPDQNLSATNFYDASSTALMASTVYRLSLIRNIHTYLPLAEKSRKALSAPSSSSSSNTVGAAIDSTTSSISLSTAPPTSIASNLTVSGMTQTSSASSSTSPAPSSSSIPDSLQHFTTDGWLTPVVDPYQINFQGTYSPEGEAFVLEMTAAWRDWVAAGSQGANGSIRISIGWMWAVILGARIILHWGF